AKVKVSANLNIVKDYNVSAVLKIDSKYKLSNKLALEDYEKWAVFGSKIQLNAIAFDGIDKPTITSQLSLLGIEIININYTNIVTLEVEISKLNQLYNLPLFYYFEQVEAPSEPENLPGVSDHRSNTIATAYTSGLQYDGTGVTVMLQDNSRLDDHIDYTGRFTDMNSQQSGDHGEHCGGTIAGAGNIDPISRGMAYGADVLVYDWNNANYNDVPNIYTNNDVRITSKSYSNGVNAGYTTLARQLDQQTRQMPELIHVFSAGNSNGQGNTSAGGQWFNVTGGHKAGKNVVTVANLTQQDVIAGSSSRGPCEDGRIKPDISAVGTNVYSTIDPNTYGFKTGTSMSCPGVAGVITQLYDAYKDLNSNNNPPSGLIKAAILNTADDIGNSGPDFIHGWGRINARRAYDLISNNNYITGSISQGGNNNHNITVPAGTDQVKIMVLWMDYEGAASASPALVNNINMDVTDPNTTNYNPWVLNSAPNATTLNLPAVRGVDNLNNMEQVTIDNPTAGTHTVSVDGFSIPQGPQTYYLVYEFITDDVVLTYPIGGEGIDSDVDEIIRWDAHGNSGTFTLEYSTNNGASWSNIATGISASQRFYNWNVPATVTGQALVRVTRGSSSSQSHQTFSVIQVPTGLTVNWACPDSMNVSWNAVAGATGYEVSLLGAKYMDSVGTAIGQTNLTIYAQSTNNHWWSVKALSNNGCEGRRAIAQYQAGGTFGCVLAIDAELVNSIPTNGSVLQSCMSGNDKVTVSITNQGQSPISNLPIFYQLNAGPTVSESVAGPIAVGATVNYTFTANMSPNLGANNLMIWNTLAGDGNKYNDTIVASFNYVNTAAQSLPWSDDFESFFTCGTASDCELEVCGLANNFVNETNGVADDIDWRTDVNGTPSNGTGPSVDFNPGTIVGKYLYLEASGAPVCSGKQANLISPCIDLTFATAASLTFGYHMSGATMGELHVDILSNGVWTNDITAVLSGDQGNSWQQRSVNLAAYLGGVVNFRFRGITGTSWESDLAIDDISVSGTVDVNEIDLNNEFSVYPNPSNGIFNFSYNGDETLNVKVVDVNGKTIYSNLLNNSGNGVIDLNNFSKGMYLIVLNNGNTVVTKKIIKE
ncbi:MAG: S8 family serine peptidase, partial [Vicingaceae bacterium]|nr:S8 family serine peptidase [Vicingaceae bacterium]